MLYFVAVLGQDDAGGLTPEHEPWDSALCVQSQSSLATFVCDLSGNELGSTATTPGVSRYRTNSALTKCLDAAAAIVLASYTEAQRIFVSRLEKYGFIVPPELALR